MYQYSASPSCIIYMYESQSSHLEAEVAESWKINTPDKKLVAGGGCERLRISLRIKTCNLPVPSVELVWCLNYFFPDTSTSFQKFKQHRSESTNIVNVFI